MADFVSWGLLATRTSGTEPGFQSLLDGLPSGDFSALTHEASSHTVAPEPASAAPQVLSKAPAPSASAGASAGALPAKRSLDPALNNVASLGDVQRQQQHQQFSTPPTQPMAGVTAKLIPNPHQPQQQPADHHGSFTIPAFKSLTQDDLILTDELDGGGALAAAFPDLADPAQLGMLPSEEDLRMQLFDPTPPPAAPLAPAPHPSLFGLPGAFFEPLLPSYPAGFAMHPSPFGGLANPFLQQQLLLREHLAAQHAAAAVLGGQLMAQQGIALAGVKEEALEEGEGGSFPGEEIDSATPPSRISSLGSIKRRMGAMDLEEPEGSPRGAKRSASINGLYALDVSSSAAAAISAAGSMPALGHSMHSIAAALGGGGDLHRVASAPQALSRFYDHSRSPSPTPTPVCRAERAAGGAAPPKAVPQHAQRAPAGQAAAAGLFGSSGSGPICTFKGVSKHKLTQRWEASLWLQGRQLYLGGFDRQEDAARAYDIAALACKGEGADINYPLSDYREQLQEVAGLTKDEVVAYVRRRSSAFSRGKSRFRGVSGHEGRWEARIGSFQGRKNVSFGIFDTEDEAARQYDRALVLEKGRTAKTNFPIRDYEAEVAAYEAYVIERCGGFDTPEAADIAQEYTLPVDRNNAAFDDNKKRPALIYAEDLRRVLWRPPVA